MVLASEPVGGRSRATELPCFIFLYFNLKGAYQIASIFDMYIIIKEKVDVNQDGLSLIVIEPPPPHPHPRPK